MNAKELLELAAEIVGADEIPADSCVVNDAERPITRMMTSINATPGDLMLARELGCNGYLLHHPLAGSARREFHRVLDRMVELMTEHGVPHEHAVEAQARLRRRCRFNDHAADWDHLASVAAHIGMPLVNIHLPADELGRRIMLDAVAHLPDDATIGDVRQALCAIRELDHHDNEVILLPDDPERHAGRIAIMHAGGTNGGASVAEALFTHADPPVGTVVYIHIAGDDAHAVEQRAAAGESGSVIVTGHLASDAIGMLRLVRELEERADIEFILHGGLRPFA